MDLTNKVIAVVGGATGIGKATAEICAARGAAVFVLDYNAADGQATAEAIKATFIQVNVTDETSVAAAFAKIGANGGHLHGLVQTAGVLKGAFLTIEEFTPEMFRQVYDVNVTGGFMCAKYAVPLMKKAGKGAIVLTSSAAAYGASSSYAYGSSKGGVSSLGITMQAKLADDNIRVNVVHPGSIATRMKLAVVEEELRLFGRPGSHGNAKLGDPEGVGKLMAWLMSDDADYVRGALHTR
ncbi:MAG: SDR family oxidoreductase [Thermoflexales bacterium]